jgi:hypothetical protein
VREHNHNAHGKEAAVHDSSGISTVENRRRGVSCYRVRRQVYPSLDVARIVPDAMIVFAMEFEGPIY